MTETISHEGGVKKENFRQRLDCAETCRKLLRIEVFFLKKFFMQILGFY